MQAILATVFQRRGIQLKDLFLVDKPTTFLSITAAVLDNTFYCVHCFMFRLSWKPSSGPGIIMIYKK